VRTRHTWGFAVSSSTRAGRPNEASMCAAMRASVTSLAVGARCSSTAPSSASLVLGCSPEWHCHTFPAGPRGRPQVFPRQFALLRIIERETLPAFDRGWSGLRVRWQPSALKRPQSLIVVTRTVSLPAFPQRAVVDSRVHLTRYKDVPRVTMHLAIRVPWCELAQHNTVFPGEEIETHVDPEPGTQLAGRRQHLVPSSGLGWEVRRAMPIDASALL